MHPFIQNFLASLRLVCSGASLLIALLGLTTGNPPAGAEEFPFWSARNDTLERAGQPRLLIAVSDTQPTLDRLVAYCKADFDAVWVKPLLNDTPQGILEILKAARNTSMPVIGGLPIPNLQELQPERLQPFVRHPAVATWVLSTANPDILQKCQATDSRRLFIVPSPENQKLPEGTGRLAPHPLKPADPGLPVSPLIVSFNFSGCAEETALRLLTDTLLGADGFFLSVHEDGLPPNRDQLRWLTPRLPPLRDFHQTLLQGKILQEPMKLEFPDALACQFITPAGRFAWVCSLQERPKTAEFKLPTPENLELLPFWHSGGVHFREGSIVLEGRGEIWLGPRYWRDKIAQAATTTADPMPHPLPQPNACRERILVLQASLERGFQFCASALGHLEREQLEACLPALLPCFHAYYGETLPPLFDLKNPRGQGLDLGEILIGGSAEKLGSEKTASRNSGEASSMPGETRNTPLKQRIEKALADIGPSTVPDTLVEDLLDLQDEFLQASLVWDMQSNAQGEILLFPLPDTLLTGGLYLLNLSPDPAELFLADMEFKKKHWTSLLTGGSEPSPWLEDWLAKQAHPGILKFSSTFAIDISRGYTLVIPPGGRREILVECDTAARGQFYYVPLNRRTTWASAAWIKTPNQPPRLHQPGQATQFLITDQDASPAPVVWIDPGWDPLDALAAPPLGASPPAELQTHLYRGERETFAWNLHNPSDRPAAFLMRVDLPLKVQLLAYAYTRAQEWTLCHPKDVLLDLRQDPPDRPLPEGPTYGPLVYLNPSGEVWIPPRQTRQALLVVQADEDTPPGNYSGRVQVAPALDAKNLMEIPLRVRVWPLSLPPRSTFSGSGYVIGSSIYRPANYQDALEHYFNVMASSALLPNLELDWEKGDLSSGELPEATKDTEGDKILAEAGFKLLLSGWGTTGMRLKGGIPGFIDECLRQKLATAAGTEASEALGQIGSGLLKGEEEKISASPTEAEDSLEDEEDSPAQEDAEKIRKKADQLKKKYWPGTAGYEQLIRVIYEKSIRYYLEQGFPPESILSYIWDEPPPEMFDSVVRMGRLMKQSFPRIRTHVTSLSDMSSLEARDAIDIFTPHMGHIFNPDMPVDALGHARPRPGANLARYRSQAMELWFYMQHTDYLQGEHAVDYPMGLLWRAWQIDAQGVGIFSLRNIRGDLGYFPTKKYEAWREGVEDLLAMRALEAAIEQARSDNVTEQRLQHARETLRIHSQEVLGLQWWWSDPARRYRLIRAARTAIAEAHLALLNTEVRP